MRRGLKKMVLFLYFVVCLVVLISANINTRAITRNQFEKNDKLVILVNEKLGEGSYEYETLLDFENNNRFILVKGKKCYLIFDTVLDDYVEFSKSDSSFYDELDDNSEKIYLAPTYYFYRSNGSIYNLYDNRKVLSSEVDKYKTFESELKESYNQIKTSGSGTRSGDDDPVYITNRYYFDNLRYNIGSNTTDLYPGSCSYVALGMLLAYYDSIANDNVIAETYDVTSTKSFSSYGSIDVANYTASPGIDDNFHEDLIQYGRDLGLTGSSSNSINVSNMDELFEEYFDDRGLLITTHITDLYTNKYNFCKSAIDSDNPVLIAISGIDTNINSNDINHAVVGYGYDATGIYAHFGWKNNYHTNTNINNYTINNAFYISFNSTHSHSNNYLWTCNGCSGTICPCGNKTCNHGSYSYTQYSSTIHKKTCNACSSQQNEAHHFQYVSGNDVCSDCGYSKTHQHSHDDHYQWTSLTNHKSYCNCGNYINDFHIVSPDAYQNGNQYAICLLCNGFASVGGTWHDGIGNYPYTLNGSFILPNGVIVLEEADMEAYLNGTLVFINPNENINRGNNQIPYIVKNEDYNIVIRR